MENQRESAGRLDSGHKCACGGLQFLPNGSGERGDSNVRDGKRWNEGHLRFRHEPFDDLYSDRKRHRRYRLRQLFGEPEFHPSGQLEIYCIVIMFTFRFLHHYRKLTPALAVLCLAALPAPAHAQYGLALSPMRTELNLVAGSQRSGSLAIANDSREPGRFRAEILDLSIDREAVPQFEKDIPSEAGFSCKDWVTANPMEAVIAGSGQAIVRYTFRVPANTPARTYHCALGFTGLPDPNKQREAIGIVSLLRLTSTFYITVGNPKPAGEVKQIAIEKINAPETAGYRAVITVENTGLTNLRGAGKVEIVNEDNEVVQSSAFPTVVILPSRTQRLPIVLEKKLTDGNYTLRTRVNLGNGEIEEAALRFQLPAPPE
jgi:hypothetical protein